MTVEWSTVKEYSEIFFERADAIAKITMNNPRHHNAFTPDMVQEMIDAFSICSIPPCDSRIDCIV